MEDNFMHKIEIEVYEIECADGLFKLAENNDDIDIIKEKNFNGDITTIEVYVGLAVSIIVAVMPILKGMIKQGKVSSLKIDGEKIEVSGVSERLIEKILKEKGVLHENSATDTKVEEMPTKNENVENNHL